MRILIVEDDADTGRLLTKYLEPIGDCDLAVNGKEAVRSFRKSFREKYPFDLVCLDILMPELDGLDTLHAIRKVEERECVQIGEGCKVLMISALSDDNTIFTSFMRLCDGYVVKPIDKKQLFSKLAEIELLSSQDDDDEIDVS